jgi:hypothetical protein
MLSQLHVSWHVNYGFEFLGMYMLFDTDWHRNCGVVRRTKHNAPIIINTGEPHFWCVMRYETSKSDSFVCCSRHGTHVARAVCHWLASVVEFNEGVLACGTNVTQLYLSVMHVVSDGDTCGDEYM